jgi:hypothetical protein
MYQCRYFKPTELLPQSWIDTYDGAAMNALDDRILISIDAIREYFAVPVTINKYAAGLFYRGLRTPGCPQYKPDSQHSFGRALDFDVLGQTADYVRGVIIKEQARWPLIRRMEIGTAWVHIDCCWTGSTKIVMVNA